MWQRGEQAEPVHNWAAYANRLLRNVAAELRRGHEHVLYDTDRCASVVDAGRSSHGAAARERLRSLPLEGRDRQLVWLLCSGIATVRGLARASGRQPCRIRSALRALTRRLANG